VQLQGSLVERLRRGLSREVVVRVTGAQAVHEGGGSETAVQKGAMGVKLRKAAPIAGVPYPSEVRGRDIESQGNWYIDRGQAKAAYR